MKLWPRTSPARDQELEKVACAVSADEYKGKQWWMAALTFSTANLLKQRASLPPLLSPAKRLGLSWYRGLKTGSSFDEKMLAAQK